MTVTTVGGGWAVGRSVALELDAGLFIVGERVVTGDLPPDLVALRGAVPAALVAELAVFADLDESWPTVFMRLANLAGVLLEDDYSAATLAMRDLTYEAALAALTEQAVPMGLRPGDDLPAADALQDLAHRVARELLGVLGPSEADVQRALTRHAREFAFLLRVMREGDLHSRVWHWLDRFAYEAYLPWRVERSETMERLEQRALAVLGAAEGNRPPPIDWLAPQNPVRLFDGIRAAVMNGSMRVVFWVDPFGLFDAAVFVPGRVVVSFSDPGELYERFGATADDLATRVKALADPTRLKILRLIRHFDADNTQLAQFMEVARPTVSVHARILQDAGLIETRREGRQARHTIQPAAVRRLFADLDRFLDLEAREEPDVERGTAPDA